MAMKGGIVKPQTKLKSGINEKIKGGWHEAVAEASPHMAHRGQFTFDRIKGRISADDFTEELYHKVAKEVFHSTRPRIQ